MPLTDYNNTLLFVFLSDISWFIFCSFDALVLRFEAPDSRNRWDSPLFTILKDDTLPYEAISDALFKRKAPPPNQSTQSVRDILLLLFFIKHTCCVMLPFFWLSDHNSDISLCSSLCHLQTFCTSWTRSHKMCWWYVISLWNNCWNLLSSVIFQITNRTLHIKMYNKSMKLTVTETAES